MMIYFDEYDLLIGIGILIILIPILWWKKHNLYFIFFFSIFWFYLIALVEVVVFPFVMGTIESGQIFVLTINIIPFYFGDCSFMPNYCIQGIVDNIVLTIPFGFGICFLLEFRQRSILWVAIAVGIGNELIQLIISYIFRSAIRAVDINDAIQNAIGVLIGYALFRGFGYLYIRIIQETEIHPIGLFIEIYNVVNRVQMKSKEKTA
jgi:glycopeptide antibiotics resistance protein